MSNLQFALERLEERERPRSSATPEAAREGAASPARSGGVDPEVIAALTDALDGAQKAAHVVKELRAFTRLDSTGYGSGDLKRAIEWALKMTEPDLQRVANVELQLVDLPPIDADELRLGQVFMNLLVNSVQAFDPARRAENRVRIVTRLEGDCAVAEVSDNGAGMSEEVRRRALEPFFTTRPIGSGTGLGLSVCHGIVTSRGTLALESTPGQGTTVRVSLPKARPERTLAKAPGSRRPRTLVIDDEELLRKAINRMIANHCDVTVPGSATEALELIQSGHRFDIIMCDLMMPDLTGMALHARLLGIAPDQASRMLFLTGGAASDEADERSAGGRR
jgi:CheY-like chemotaxis protein